MRLFIFNIITLLLLVISGVFSLQEITYGSAVKFLNTVYQTRLHSHDVKYGSGSGQQSVTAVHSVDDTNSNWQILCPLGNVCKHGTPIKCGSVLRLFHLATSRFLHSHHFQSPLSKNLEVSAFGSQHESDDGDHWIVECDEQYWLRDEHVRFKHPVTNGYLHVSGEVYGRPIQNQMEVSVHSRARSQNVWTCAEGVYVKPIPNPLERNSEDSFHSEL